MKKIEFALDKIFKTWDRNNKPGFALSIIKENSDPVIKCFGNALLNHEIPVNENTVFYLCSLSKQFTAFCMAVLINDNKLSLNDKLIDFFPELPDKIYKDIKISHLLHMCSGIHEWYDIIEYSGNLAENYSWRESLLPVLAKQKNLSYFPGDKHSYCNSNYSLLVLIIEKITGQNIQDFAKKHIFEPLNMKSTSFCEDNQQIIPFEAYGYLKEENQYKTADKFPPLLGAGGVYSDIRDMNIWLKTLIDADWNYDIVKIMLIPSSFNNGKMNPYLMGFEILEYRNMQVIIHGGAVPGFFTHIGFIPQRKSGFVWLANHNDFKPLVVNYKILDLLASPENHSSAIPQSPKDINMIEYAGNYVSVKDDKNVQLDIDDRCFLLRGDSTKYHYRYSTSFVNPADISEILNVKEYHGIKILRLISKNSDEFYIKSSKLPETKNMSEFTGKYYSSELNISWNIIENNNSLKIEKAKRFSTTNLRMIASNIFISPEKGIKIRFIKNSSKKITAFYLDSFRSQNFVFYKTD